MKQEIQKARELLTSVLEDLPQSAVKEEIERWLGSTQENFHFGQKVRSEGRGRRDMFSPIEGLVVFTEGGAKVVAYEYKGKTDFIRIADRIDWIADDVSRVADGKKEAVHFEFGRRVVERLSPSRTGMRGRIVFNKTGDMFLAHICAGGIEFSPITDNTRLKSL